jgi:hypothetical protein
MHNRTHTALKVDGETWLDSLQNYIKNYNTVIGTREWIKQFAQALGRKWFFSSGYSLQIYQTSSVGLFYFPNDAYPDYL